MKARDLLEADGDEEEIADVPEPMGMEPDEEEVPYADEPPRPEGPRIHLVPCFLVIKVDGDADVDNDVDAAVAAVRQENMYLWIDEGREDVILPADTPFEELPVTFPGRR